MPLHVTRYGTGSLTVAQCSVRIVSNRAFAQVHSETDAFKGKACEGDGDCGSCASKCTDIARRTFARTLQNIECRCMVELWHGTSHCRVVCSADRRQDVGAWEGPKVSGEGTTYWENPEATSPYIRYSMVDPTLGGPKQCQNSAYGTGTEAERFPCLASVDVESVSALLDPFAFVASCFPGVTVECRDNLDQYDPSKNALTTAECDDRRTATAGASALALVAGGRGACAAGRADEHTMTGDEE